MLNVNGITGPITALGHATQPSASPKNPINGTTGPIADPSHYTQASTASGNIAHEVLEHCGIKDPGAVLKNLAHTPQIGALLMTAAGIEALVKVATHSGGGLCVPGANFSSAFMGPIMEGLKPIVTEAIQQALHPK